MVNKRLVAALNRRLEIQRKQILDDPENAYLKIRRNECMTIKQCIERNEFDLL